MSPENHAMKVMAIWIGVSLAISMLVNFLMFTFLGEAAFPWNLVIIVGLFLFLARWVARRQLSGKGFGFGMQGFDKAKLTYVCNSCSQIYKGDVCPRCGFKGGQAAFA